MCLIITLFLILTTILEVKLLGLFGQSVGSAMMWLWVLASVWGGSTLMREQREMSEKMQQRMARGEVNDPLDLLRPLVMTLSGILLILPGLITDTIGVLLLFPPIARWALKQLAQRGMSAAQANFKGAGKTGGFGGFGQFGGQFGGFGGGFGGFEGGRGDPRTPPDASPHKRSKSKPQPVPHLKSQSQSQSSSKSSSKSRDEASSAHNAPLREGIHRTQKPQPDAWDTQKNARSQRSVNPQEVIIDVDAEVIDE